MRDSKRGVNKTKSRNFRRGRIYNRRGRPAEMRDSGRQAARTSPRKYTDGVVNMARSSVYRVNYRTDPGATIALFDPQISPFRNTARGEHTALDNAKRLNIHPKKRATIAIPAIERYV